MRPNKNPNELRFQTSLITLLATSIHRTKTKPRRERHTIYFRIPLAQWAKRRRALQAQQSANGSLFFSLSLLIVKPSRLRYYTYILPTAPRASRNRHEYIHPSSRGRAVASSTTRYTGGQFQISVRGAKGPLLIYTIVARRQ